VQDAVPDAPWARAVIRNGTITLNPWSPELMSGGPQRTVLAPLARRGVALADLSSDVREDGTEELRVAWVPAGASGGAAADVLIAWAEQVGYRRVWLPDRVVDLTGRLSTGGRAAVTCPTCRLSWEDESPEFWTFVRCSGHFPATCPVCNGSLPEWRVVCDAARLLAGSGGG
jgi:hypothetical protein